MQRASWVGWGGVGENLTDVEYYCLKVWYRVQNLRISLRKTNKQRVPMYSSGLVTDPY